MSSTVKPLIRRMILDCLKPHEPELNIVASKLITSCEGVEGVNITVYSNDKLTQNVKIIIEGQNLDYEEIQTVLLQLNVIVHSLDQVVAGEKIIEDIDTPQD